MTVFESSAVINRPVSEVYTFLSDLNNHQQLMSDNVQEWSSTKDDASFSVQGMIKLSLTISEKIPNQQVTIVPKEKAPFEMELRWILSAAGTQTEVKYTINADLNMMMKMMASGPLQKLVNHEVEVLCRI